jgi:hypothetical protein
VIRAILIALLALLPGSACAQKDQFSKSSPAIIAFDLYMTCIRGEFTSTIPTFDTNRELDEFVTYLDDKCISWAVVWFTPFVGYTVDKMSSDRTQTFVMLRQGVLDDIRKRLAASLPKSKGAKN